jgi:hypothetical protein
VNDESLLPEPVTRYYWPNKMGRMFLLALEDVMGKNGVNAVLNLARLRHLINNYPPNNLDLGWSFDEMGALNQALEDMYGPRGGRGLATRAGRAGLYYALKDFAAVLGIADLAFRLLPMGMKLDHFLYYIDLCPVCWGRQAQTPICYGALGLLQEGLHWVTGGKNVRVEEIECIAMGHPSCVFIVQKRPLG